MPKKTKVRAIYVSDLHIGCKSSQCSKFLEFLEFFEYDELYLLGDMIDGYVLKSRLYWTKCYTDFIQSIIRMSKHKKVYYLPGNHDDFLREYDGMDLGGLTIANECIISRSGYKILAVHGDIFDHGLIHGTPIYKIGSVLYYCLQSIDRMVKWVIPGFSLSYPSKVVIKKCTNHISNYKESAINYADALGCNVVITGHVHIPENKTIGQSCYLNCGDWIDNLSGVVETESGEFYIVKYSDFK